MALVRVFAVLSLLGLLTGAPVATERIDASTIAADRERAQSAVSRDTARGYQWQLGILNAAKTWQISTGAGVTVAVVDSGVDASHPDLAGRVLSGLDLVEPSGDGTRDPVGHGTAVAGLIVGHSEDGRGASGLAPDAKILPVRVLDASNAYKDDRVVADGIRWAVDQGAKVINLSLGGENTSPAISAAIDYALDRDAVVVACVGNVIKGKPQEVWFPARKGGVLAVTALNGRGEVWRGALTGPSTVLAAPGAELVGAKPGGGYQWLYGTSFAAPLVAATAALIRSEYPSMSAPNVINRLVSTTRDEGLPGRDDQFGYGVLNPYAALTVEAPLVSENPLENRYRPSVPEIVASVAPTTVTSLVAAVSSATGPHPALLAGAFAGFAALIGTGLTLLRRLLPPG